MKDELKNIFLAGIGSAAYTYEKASNLVDNLVAKGKITVNDGKELSEELKRNLKDKSKIIKDKTNNIKPLTKQDIKDALKEMNYASKDELEELKQLVINLEKKVEELSNK